MHVKVQQPWWKVLRTKPLWHVWYPRLRRTVAAADEEPIIWVDARDYEMPEYEMTEVDEEEEEEEEDMPEQRGK